MIVVILLLTAGGFGALCLSMQRHFSQLFNVRHPPRRTLLTLRLSGYSTLTAAIALSIVDNGFGTGLTFWFMLAAPVVIAVALCLPANWK